MNIGLRAGGVEAIAPIQNTLNKPTLFDSPLLDNAGHIRHQVIFVIQGQIVKDVFLLNIHTAHALTHDNRQLIAEGRIVTEHAGHRAGEHM